MTGKKNRNPMDPIEQNSTLPAGEVDLSEFVAEGGTSWEDAISELSNLSETPQPVSAKKVEPKPAAPAAEVEEKDSPVTTPTPIRGASQNKLKELMNKPAMKVSTEDVVVMEELSSILSQINSAANGLKKFERDHPYLIAPNILRMWEDNLKETSTVMLREFHNLRNGRQAKTYDPRCVCTSCRTVHMVPIPGGVCDECLSQKNRPGGAY